MAIRRDGGNSPPGELIQYIKTNSNFIIAGHKEPDGDCVGSQLALRSALLRLGKKAIVCSAGPFKRTELKGYAEHFETIPKDTIDAKVILVDCTSIDRTGDIMETLEKLPIAVIDHHAAENHQPSTLDRPVYVDDNMPSCTLLVYKLIKALGLEITKEEAVLLFFGMCTDTGFFRYLTEDNADVFFIASELIKCGASPKEIHKIIYGGKSLNSRILMGHILSKTESYFDGKLMLSYETLDEFNTFGIESRDSDSLNQMMLSIEGLEAFVTIRQECIDSCTVSLRSKDKINVAQIAYSFGGGGHKNAAGLTMKGDIPFVKQSILNSFQNIFNLK